MNLGATVIIILLLIISIVDKKCLSDESEFLRMGSSGREVNHVCRSIRTLIFLRNKNPSFQTFDAASTAALLPTGPVFGDTADLLEFKFTNIKRAVLS